MITTKDLFPNIVLPHSGFVYLSSLHSYAHASAADIHLPQITLSLRICSKRILRFRHKQFQCRLRIGSTCLDLSLRLIGFHQRPPELSGIASGSRTQRLPDAEFVNTENRLHLRQTESVTAHFADRQNRLILRTDQTQQLEDIFPVFQKRAEHAQRLSSVSRCEGIAEGENIPGDIARHRVFNVLRRNPAFAESRHLSRVVDQIVQRIIRIAVIITGKIDKQTRQIRIKCLPGSPEPLRQKGAEQRSRKPVGKS